MNIANWLSAQALNRPSAPALFEGTKQQATYAQFAQAAQNLSEQLVTHYGCQPGDRVVLYAPNQLNYLIAMHAVWWFGGVIVPVNYRLHPKEIAWILNDTQAKVVLSQDGLLHEAITLPATCSELALALLTPLSVCSSAPLDQPVSRDDQDLAWLFYTSGTTGKPKGVMLSHQNLIAMSLCYPTDVHAIDANDHIYYAAPMSHGSGLYNFVFIRHGARHVIPASQGFDGSELLATADQLGQLCFFAAPTMLKRLTQIAQQNQHTGQGIKAIVCGGAPLYIADYLAARQQLGPIIQQIYGQGESPMTISSLNQQDLLDDQHPHWPQRVASVGRPHSCIEIAIRDPKGQPCPPTVSGEVWVRGATIMQGYWANPSATAETIQNNWLKTGDIGYLDFHGYLTLTDRSKDVIISGGSNIYPREIEEILLQHEAVFDAAVVGHPDMEWGEIVTAHLVTRDQCPIDATVLDEWCKTHLAAFKRPKAYYFYPELPKNSYGKVIKQLLISQQQ